MPRVKAPCAFPGCSEEWTHLRCSRCRRARYCGAEHQKAHWKGGHQQDCQDVGGQGEWGADGTRKEAPEVGRSPVIWEYRPVPEWSPQYDSSNPNKIGWDWRGEDKCKQEQAEIRRWTSQFSHLSSTAPLDQKLHQMEQTCAGLDLRVRVLRRLLDLLRTQSTASEVEEHGGEEMKETTRQGHHSPPARAPTTHSDLMHLLNTQQDNKPSDGDGEKRSSSGPHESEDGGGGASRSDISSGNEEERKNEGSSQSLDHSAVVPQEVITTDLIAQAIQEEMQSGVGRVQGLEGGAWGEAGGVYINMPTPLPMEYSGLEGWGREAVLRELGEVTRMLTQHANSIRLTKQDQQARREWERWESGHETRDMLENGIRRAHMEARLGREATRQDIEESMKVPFDQRPRVLGYHPEARALMGPDAELPFSLPFKEPPQDQQP